MEKLSSKEIVSDINKMKELKRIIRIKSSEKIKEYNKTSLRCDGLSNTIANLSIIINIIGVCTANILLIIINMIVSVKLIEFISDLEKGCKIAIRENIESRQKLIEPIEQYIENNEAIIEFRRGKELNGEQIKNLNICFILDESYSYDLKKINKKYNYDNSKIKHDSEHYMSVEQFYDTLNPITKDYDLEKVKKKAMIIIK